MNQLVDAKRERDIRTCLRERDSKERGVVEKCWAIRLHEEMLCEPFKGYEERRDCLDDRVSFERAKRKRGVAII